MGTQNPGHEFRIEDRIRVSHAPRCVNLQVATQRSTDYDANLRRRGYDELPRYLDLLFLPASPMHNVTRS
jgi:hypothetical protein